MSNTFEQVTLRIPPKFVREAKALRPIVAQRAEFRLAQDLTDADLWRIITAEGIASLRRGAQASTADDTPNDS